jgi:molecular chaperone IbpA
MTSQLSLRSMDIPQIHRFGVGFDRMISQIDEILRINAQHNSNYPPFNMIKHDQDHYTIEIAVAGFKPGEVTITVKANELLIEGCQVQSENESNVKDYIHRGISGRDFQRVFWLNDNVIVKEARQENGILSIDLVRIIPDEEKAKSIPINYIG